MTDPNSTQVSCPGVAMASVSHLSLILGAPSSLLTAWVSQGLAQLCLGCSGTSSMMGGSMAVP